MPRSSLVLGLVLAACAPSRQDAGEAAAPERLRLCVQNVTVGYGNLVARAGLTRFDVLPGQEVCKAISRADPDIALRAETTGGGATGPRSYTATLQPVGSRCWRWRLTNQPGSAGDLMPCD